MVLLIKLLGDFLTAEAGTSREIFRQNILTVAKKS